MAIVALALTVPLRQRAMAQVAPPLPTPLVFLSDIDSTILQDMRYATPNNFTGRVVVGYEGGECMLLRSVAVALSAVQRDLAPQGYGLKVYDCYRPTRAVRSFAAWVRDGRADALTVRFHPRVARSELHSRGYIATTSLHSQGRAVDLTLVRLPVGSAPAFDPTRLYGACNGPKEERAPDNGLDMGTDFDCFDTESHVGSKDIGEDQRRARQILAKAMTRRGFAVYSREWWHFDHYAPEGEGRAFDVPIPMRRR